MPLSEQRGDGAAIAVDLGNSWDEYDRPPELLDLRWLRRWLEWHGFPRLAEGAGEGDGGRARALSGRVAAAFDAGGPDEGVEILNGVVAELGTPPRLERSGRRWLLRAWPDEDE